MSIAVPQLNFMPPDYAASRFGSADNLISQQAAQLSHPYKGVIVSLIAQSPATVTTSELRDQIGDRTDRDIAIPCTDTFLYLGRQLAAKGIVDLSGSEKNELSQNDTTRTLAAVAGAYATFAGLGVDPSAIFGKPQGPFSQVKRFMLFREVVATLRSNEEFNVLEKDGVVLPERARTYRRDTLQKLAETGLFLVTESGRPSTKYRLTSSEIRLYSNTTELRTAAKELLEKGSAVGIDEISAELERRKIAHTRTQIAQYMGDLYKRGHVDYLVTKPKDGLFSVREADVDVADLSKFIGAMDVLVQDPRRFALTYAKSTEELLDQACKLQAYLEPYQLGTSQYSTEKIARIRASLNGAWMSVAEVSEGYTNGNKARTGTSGSVSRHTVRRYLRILTDLGVAEKQASPNGSQYRLLQ